MIDSPPVNNVVRGFEAARWLVRFFRDPIRCLQKAHHSFGPLSAVGKIFPAAGPQRLYVFALGPDYNRQVLSQAALFHTTSYTWRGAPNSAQRNLHYGLTRMNGEQHREQRRLMQPLFLKSAMLGYFDQMVDIIGRRLDGWSAGQQVDMYHDMQQLALEVSAQLLFGGEGQASARRLARCLRRWKDRTFQAAVWMFPLDLPGTAYRDLLGSANEAQEILASFVARRRAAPSRSTDILQLLIDARDANSDVMTDRELYSQAVTMFAGSYENIATTLTWTLLLLAQHPAVMDRVVEELEWALRGESPTFAELDNLVVLDAVVKESMRILPSVPYLVRTAAQETELGNLQLGRRAHIIVSPYFTQHMPELFPQPERFLPQRWLTINPGTYEYLPFGAGPRFCIGYLFGMTEIKLCLAMLLQKWRVQLEPGARIDRTVRIQMRPRADVPMTIHRPGEYTVAVPLTGQINQMVDFSPTLGEQDDVPPLNQWRSMHDQSSQRDDQGSLAMSGR